MMALQLQIEQRMPELNDSRQQRILDKQVNIIL